MIPIDTKEGELRRCPTCEQWADSMAPDPHPDPPEATVMLTCGDRVRVTDWETASLPTGSDPVALIVLGSEGWTDTAVIDDVLRQHAFTRMEHPVPHAVFRPVTLLHGDSRSDLDLGAQRVARLLGWQLLPMPLRFRADAPHVRDLAIDRMLGIADCLQESGYRVIVYGFALPGPEGADIRAELALAAARQLDVRLVRQDGKIERFRP